VTARDEIPGLGLPTDRPRINHAADLTVQNLTPTEAFVLSRVDGQLSYDDICKVSGLGRDQTLDILRALKRAKLILGPNEIAVGGAFKYGRPATPRPEATGDANKTTAPEAERRVPSQESGDRVDTSRPMSAPATSRMSEPLERLDDGTPVAAFELEDWPDGDPRLKERIIRLHRRMRALSPYELLGIPENADHSTIRRAFALASKTLHPDRYFGKDMGSFKAKLAAIFTRLTEAVQEIEGERKEKR